MCVNLRSLWCLRCSAASACRVFVVLLVAIAFFGEQSRAVAQDKQTSPIDPRIFGLNIPPGPVRGGDNQCVTVTDDDGNAVIGKIYVEVGDHRIVMLPDGQLVARPSRETRLTERVFEPASKDAIAEHLTSGSFKDFKVSQTDNYLYIYNTSDEFALVTSRIMETMLPGLQRYVRAQRIPEEDPEVPLVVIMFRTEDEYQKYRRMPPGVVAYYNILDNRVVMYEESRLALVKPDLAIQQSISVIAHEGAHQILHNIGVQKRLSVWPLWLAEGLAEYLAPTTTGRKLNWKGAGHVNDMRMFELENYLKSKSNDGLNGKTIEHTVLAARLTSTGYASAWSLTHYLAKNRRTEFHKYVAEMSKLGPLEGNFDIQEGTMIPENLRLFKRHFGDDLPDMENRLVLHLKKQPYIPPFGEFPHFVVTVAYPDGRKVQRDANLFLSAEQADQWRRDTLEKLPADQRSSADAHVHQYPNRDIANRFMQQWLAGN